MNAIPDLMAFFLFPVTSRAPSRINRTAIAQGFIESTSAAPITVNKDKEFKDSPYFGSQADQIDYESRIKMQSIAQKYICHAISSTVNLPNEINVETVEKLYLNFHRHSNQLVL